jgi:uncharacterized protein (TIGR02246 family)
MEHEEVSLMKPAPLFATLSLLLIAIATGPLAAQPRRATTGPTNRPADEKAVRDAAQAFSQAFEKGDVRAVGSLFTEEGEYVDEDGEPVRGRAALEKAYGAFFTARRGVKTTATTSAVRFLGKDTAVEEGTFIVRAEGQPPNTSRYSTLYVREGGRWLIAMLKEWGDETTARANLEDLAWLIGTWEGEGPEMRARTTYEWGENKTLIRSQFKIVQKKDNAVVASGTQIINVDPTTGLIRSRTFDATGGTGEAFWTWDGDRWVIDSVGVLADGEETSAINLLTRSGDDAFTWRSVERMEGGESQPDLPAIRVKRVSAASASTEAQPPPPNRKVSATKRGVRR